MVRFVFLALIAIGIVVLNNNDIFGENLRLEDIKIGDCVSCIWGSKDIEVKDKKEYGPPIKYERIADGVITEIQDEEVLIELKSIADYNYIKKFSLWMPNLSVHKRPPYNIGDIYKCKKPTIRKVENGLTVTEIYTIIKKISCEDLTAK